MNDGKSWNDDPLEMEEQCDSDKYMALVKQAKGLLRQWRTTLKKHDFVSCSNVVVTSARESHEKEHGENESIKLYETQVLELACGGDCTDYSLVTGRNGSNDVLLPQGAQLAKVEVEGRTVVPLRDCISGNVVPYTLRPGEYAILVHYKDRSVDFDRWVILPYNDEEDSGVLNYWDGGNDDLAEVGAGKVSVEETNGVSHKGGAYYKDGYIITDNGKFDVGLVLPLDSHVASVSALENYIQTKKSIPKEEKSVLPIAVDKPAVKRQSNGQTKDKKRKSLAKTEMVPSKKPSKLKQGVSRVETESKNQTQKSIETDAVPPKEHILSKSTSISIENSVEGSAVDDLSAPVQRKTKGSSKKLKNVKKNKSEPLKTQKESKPGPPEDNADSVKDASNEKPTQSTTKDTKLGTTQVSTTDKQSAPPPASPKKKSDRKKKDKEESQLEFTWICTECREAECFTDPSSPLLLCDGKCNRPFHYPCADLLSMPPENEPWLCTDCKQQRHQCAVCKLYGEDDVDVFCCESKTCGLFFHEACLAMYNVDIQVLEEVVAVKSDDASEDQTDKELDDVGLEDLTNIEGHAIEKCADEDASIVLTIPEASTNESNSVHNVEASSTKKKDSEYLTKIISRPKFRCPAHDCWTCCDDIPPPEMGESDAPEEAKKGKRGKKRKPAHGTFLSMYGAKKERLFVSKNARYKSTLTSFSLLIDTHFPSSS